MNSKQTPFEFFQNSLSCNQTNFLHDIESHFPTRTSNGYEEEYGLIQYVCMVENKIEIMPFLYNVAPIP